MNNRGHDEGSPGRNAGLRVKSRGRHPPLGASGRPVSRLQAMGGRKFGEVGRPRTPASLRGDRLTRATERGDRTTA
jgi:hypothetical protein